MGNLATEKVQLSIQNLREKKARIYFFVQDTKGNAKASIRLIYQMADALKKEGFNPIMLHEKNDYVGVASWLGEEYMTLPHKAIEGQNLEISPEDFLIIPEIFGFIMEQVSKLPCAKIVLTQQYSNMLETLQPGQGWAQFGFYKCITTSNLQKDYIERVMRQSTFDIVKPYIGESFSPKPTPPMPIVAVHTKEQSDAVNLIKTFYLKFPQYRWFTFRDLRGLSEKDFAKSLKECFLSIWIDDKSGFGTFPLESMACGVPTIGKIPDLQPEWMTEDNGIWVTDVTLMSDFIADFIQNWLEDGIKPELFDHMKETVVKYQNKQEFETSVVNLFETFLTTRADSFEELVIVHTQEETLVTLLNEYDFGNINVTKLLWDKEPNYCAQVNFGVENAKGKWVSLFEFDDEYSLIWFKKVKKYMEAYPEVQIFLPIVVDTDEKDAFAGFTNEATFAANFSQEIGYLTNDTLQEYQNFQTAGSVIKKEVLQDFGGFKPSMKLTFVYELLLRLTYNSVSIMTIPRLGYRHSNLREGSIFWGYRYGDDKILEDEVKFWIASAKREYFFTDDRVIKYQPENE